MDSFGLPNPLENLGVFLQAHLGYVILFTVLGIGGLYLYLRETSTCPSCNKPWVKRFRNEETLKEKIEFQTENKPTTGIDASGQTATVQVRVPYRHIDFRTYFVCESCEHTWSKDGFKIKKA